MKNINENEKYNMENNKWKYKWKIMENDKEVIDNEWIDNDKEMDNEVNE